MAVQILFFHPLRSWKFALLFLMLLILGTAPAFAWVNPGFETGTLTGWTTATGSGAAVVCAPPSVTVVPPGAAPDSVGPLAPAGLNQVHTGNYAAQLFSARGDNGHADWAQISQSDTVPTDGTCCLSFWFAGVFEDHHYLSGDVNGDTYLLVEVLIGGATVASLRYTWSNNLGQIVVNGLTGGGNPGFCQDSDGGNDFGYLPWTQYTINLCKYAGQQATLRVSDYDCVAGGHFGLGYLDDVSWGACPSPSVILTKANSPTGTVSAGQTITYTMTYTNTGTSPIAGVVVNDTIPAGTTYVPGSMGSNPSLPVTDMVGNDLIWDVGYLYPGNTGTVSFQVVAGPGCGNVPNTAVESDLETAGLTSNTVVNAVSGCAPTFTATSNATSTSTSTSTPIATATATSTWSATNSATSTFTATSTSTATVTDTFTWTATATVTPTSTWTSTPTFSYTPTSTFTPTMTPTVTATPTVTNTPTPSLHLQKSSSKTLAYRGDTVAYTLTLNVLGSTAAAVQVTDTLPAQEIFEGFGAPSPSMPGQSMGANGQVLSWNFPSLNPGTYLLPYTIQVQNGLSEGASLVNTAQAFFAEGSSQPVSLSLLVAAPFHVVIGVYNQAGELVATILDQAFSHPVTAFQLSATSITTANGAVSVEVGGAWVAVWNGAGPGLSPITNGQYFIQAQSTDPYGVVTTVTQQVGVNLDLSTIIVNIYNEAGEVIKHLYETTSRAAGAAIQSLQLSSALIQPGQGAGQGTPAITTIQVAGGGGSITLTWDGTNDQGAIVSNGQYYVEAQMMNGQGGGNQTITQKVAVLNNGRGTAAGQVYAAPNFLSPGQTAAFSVGSAQSLTLKVLIYDMAGERVASVQGPTGGNQASWNTAGFASGLYIALVELSGPNGVVSRQTLHLVVK